MPKFEYTGPSLFLHVAGARLTRGQPVELEGRAAAAAAEHPDIREVSDKPAARSRAPKADSGSGSADALAARRALVARAKELGIAGASRMKSDALAAAVAEAEAEEPARGREAE